MKFRYSIKSIKTRKNNSLKKSAGNAVLGVHEVDVRMRLAKLHDWNTCDFDLRS